MTALLIDFATRRAVPSEWRPRPGAKLPHDERSELRRRWRRRQDLMQAAGYEMKALHLRLMAAPVGDTMCTRLRIAYRVAEKARDLAKETLMRTPAPHAKALAWKRQQKQISPEAEAVMAEDEAFLAPRRRSSRRA